jgi:nucleosome binding factor SPN SPT16 subunit
VSAEALTNGQKGMTYAINLADVVLVKAAAPEVLTQAVPKQYKNISYQLQDEETDAPQ